MTRYRLTSESKKIPTESGTVDLFRIEALEKNTLYGVEPGDLGGFVEHGDNLDQDCEAWVGGDAVVYGNAVVLGSAHVSENAVVGENAVVSGGAGVYGNARVLGSATVSSHAFLYGGCLIDDGGQVYGNAVVKDRAAVNGNAVVFGDAVLGGHCTVTGDARVFGGALVDSFAVVGGNASVAAGMIDVDITGDARIGEVGHVLTVLSDEKKPVLVLVRTKSGHYVHLPLIGVMSSLGNWVTYAHDGGEGKRVSDFLPDVWAVDEAMREHLSTWEWA